MIVFDLRCDPVGHVFEAWFGSSLDFDNQRERGLVQCPLCGTLEVAKAVMAPRLGAGGKRSPGSELAPADNPHAVKTELAVMASLQRLVLENSEHVGDRFAHEARAIYLGETEARSIYGRATAAETQSLREEGIAVASLPFPVVLPGEEN